MEEMRGDHKFIKFSTFSKQEREKQNLWFEGKGIRQGVCFADQGAIECTIGFTIDSRTIKKVALKFDRLSKCLWV